MEAPLAMIIVVAWRTVYLLHLERSKSEVAAGAYFGWTEIIGSYVSAKKPQPTRPSPTWSPGSLRRAATSGQQSNGQLAGKAIWKGAAKIRLVAEGLREINSDY